MTSIFEKNNFEDNSVLAIEPINHNGYWVFRSGNKYYNIAPSHSTQLVLSPNILGVDKLMLAACKFKNIDPHKGFKIISSENYLENCDVRLEYNDSLFDGWVYNMYPEYFKDVQEHQKIWMCPYLKLYYEMIPKIIYIRIDVK